MDFLPPDRFATLAKAFSIPKVDQDYKVLLSPACLEVLQYAPFPYSVSDFPKLDRWPYRPTIVDKVLDDLPTMIEGRESLSMAQ